MTKTEAMLIQKEIEAVLKRKNVHYRIEYVKQPGLKFINMEVSIKITEK